MLYYTIIRHYYAPAASAGRGHRAFGLSVRVYVHTSVRPSVDQVKISVQGGISSPFNGSRLIFHMRVYQVDILLEALPL